MTALLLAAGATAAVDWVAVARGWRRVEEVLKPTVMVLLIGWVASVESPAGVRGWVVAALTLSLIGDVALLPRVDAFVPGLVAFLLGHLAYLPALAPSADPATGVVAAGVLGLAAVLVGRRVAAAAAERSGAALGAAVRVYVLAVGATGVVAVATQVPAVAVGGVLFVVSDAVLGWNRFVAPLPAGRVVVMVTYHLAQFGLVQIALA